MKIDLIDLFPSPRDPQTNVSLSRWDEVLLRSQLHLGSISLGIEKLQMEEMASKYLYIGALHTQRDKYVHRIKNRSRISTCPKPTPKEVKYALKTLKNNKVSDVMIVFIMV